MIRPDELDTEEEWLLSAMESRREVAEPRIQVTLPFTRPDTALVQSCNLKMAFLQRWINAIPLTSTTFETEGCRYVFTEERQGLDYTVLEARTLKTSSVAPVTTLCGLPGHYFISDILDLTWLPQRPRSMLRNVRGIPSVASRIWELVSSFSLDVV